MADQEPSSVPDRVETTRPVGDVPEGDEPCPILINAARSGDIAALEGFLTSEEGSKEARRRVRSIHLSNTYSERCVETESPDPRSVTVLVHANAMRAIDAASVNGQGAAYTVLDRFAYKHKLVRHPHDPCDERLLVIRAIRHNHVDMFKAIVAAHPRALTEQMSHLGRPLKYACWRRRGEMMRTILELGAHLDLATLSGGLSYVSEQSLLGQTMRYFDYQTVGPVLRHQAHTGALHHAAYLGHPHGIHCGVGEGGDVNERFSSVSKGDTVRDSWTPLHYAAATDHGEIMELLQTYGADPELKDKEGKTPAQLLEVVKQAKEIAQQASPDAWIEVWPDKDGNIRCVARERKST